MSKSKSILVVLGIVLFVSAIIGGATFYVLKNKSSDNIVRAQDVPTVGETLGDSTGSDSISLNSGQKSTQKSSGGLSVSNGGTADNLGQLTPNQLGSGQSNGSGNSGGSSSSNNSSNNAASIFDPKTFAQYDKYKDATNALFGDVEKGSGAELGNNMKAAVYYKGWLTNGTLFDQSRPDSSGKVQPFVFTLGAHEVIPGWEQALAGMKVGGTRLVIVPPSVGYGAQGQSSIPPNSVLIFQVQLAQVQ